MWVCMWASWVMDRYMQFTIALFPDSFESRYMNMIVHDIGCHLTHPCTISGA